MFNELWDDEIVEDYEKHNLEALLIVYLFLLFFSIYLLYKAYFWFFFFLIIYFYYKNKKNRNLNKLQQYILESELTFLKRLYNNG